MNSIEPPPVGCVIDEKEPRICGSLTLFVPTNHMLGIIFATTVRSPSLFSRMTACLIGLCSASIVIVPVPTVRFFVSSIALRSASGSSEPARFSASTRSLPAS